MHPISINTKVLAWIETSQTLEIIRIVAWTKKFPTIKAITIISDIIRDQVKCTIVVDELDSTILKGSLDLGLWLSKSSPPLSINAFSDANWAGCSIDRKPIRGYYVFLGNSIINWSAKKQPTVTRSSTKAEYRSLANTATKLTWICKPLVGVGKVISFPPKL